MVDQAHHQRLVAKQPVSYDVPSRQPQPRKPAWSPAGVIGVGVVALLILAALIGPLIVSTDPEKQDLLSRLTPPIFFGGSTSHLLGTDGLGRDLLARVVAGARISLLVGVVATLVAGAIGVLARTHRRLRGRTRRRDSELLGGCPIGDPVCGRRHRRRRCSRKQSHERDLCTRDYRLGRVHTNRAVADSIIRNAPFIEAARAIGVGPGRLVWRHLLPNVAGPIIVVASQQIAAMILYEAALSYLGLGVPSSRITWGGMVADGRQTLMTSWWVSTIPGFAIVLTVLGFNLLGDWLRDRLDPVTRSRRSLARL